MLIVERTAGKNVETAVVTNPSKVHIGSDACMYGCGWHTTPVRWIAHNLNQVWVATESGTAYQFTFMLYGHGKAEWKQAQQSARELAIELESLLQLALSEDDDDDDCWYR